MVDFVSVLKILVTNLPKVRAGKAPAFAKSFGERYGWQARSRQ
jgi:hypothetical protein